MSTPHNDTYTHTNTICKIHPSCSVKLGAHSWLNSTSWSVTIKLFSSALSFSVYMHLTEPVTLMTIYIRMCDIDCYTITTLLQMCQPRTHRSSHEPPDERVTLTFDWEFDTDVILEIARFDGKLKKNIYTSCRARERDLNWRTFFYVCETPVDSTLSSFSCL